MVRLELIFMMNSTLTWMVCPLVSVFMFYVVKFKSFEVLQVNMHCECGGGVVVLVVQVCHVWMDLIKLWKEKWQSVCFYTFNCPLLILL